jgi:predicted aminopeptidase
MTQLRRPTVVATLLLLVAMLGCDGLTYVAQLAQGQARVQGHVEPIDDVLASGRLSDADAAKLRLIVKARDFAANTVGLRAGASYTQFYDTGGDPLAWNLSAATKDALEPQTWVFPIVGEVPYLSFFDENYLHEIEQQYIDAGYDTETYELDAYSTLGVFADPVRSTMLRRGTLSLAETIIHELLHNTVWRANDTVFNESLATFVGRQGAVEFLTAEFGVESGWPQTAVAFYADTDAVNAFLMQLYAELAAFYGQEISSDEKIAGRDAVFQAGRDRFVTEIQPALYFPDSFSFYTQLPTNNAWMLANYRYNMNLDVFANVYTTTGRDWAATLDVFRAAATGADNPLDYLQSWLAGQSP